MSRACGAGVGSPPRPRRRGYWKACASRAVTAVLLIAFVGACGSPSAGGSSKGTGKPTADPRVVAAVAATQAKRSARVQLAVSFSGDIATRLGLSPNGKILGAGIVDFAHQRAQWTVTLPASLGGSNLEAEAIGNTMYVNPGPLGAEAGFPHPWLQVDPSGLGDLSRLGIERDLVLLLNPLATLALADSTQPGVTVAPAGRIVPPGSQNRGTTVAAGFLHPASPAVDGNLPARAPVVAGPASSDAKATCGPTTGIDLSAPLDPKKLNSVRKDWVETYKQTLETYKQQRQVMQVDSAGILARSEIQLGLAENQQIKAEEKFCDYGTAADINAPANPLDIKSWVTLDTCLIGVWQLVGPLHSILHYGPGPGAVMQGGVGTQLTIAPNGTAYFNHSAGSPYIIAENLQNSPALALASITYAGVDTQTVFAPLARKGKLIWTDLGLGESSLTALVSGIPGQPPEVGIPLPSGKSFLRADYDCNKANGTLSTKVISGQPPDNSEDATFKRLSSDFTGPPAVTPMAVPSTATPTCPSNAAITSTVSSLTVQPAGAGDYMISGTGVITNRGPTAVKLYGADVALTAANGTQVADQFVGDASGTLAAGQSKAFLFQDSFLAAVAPPATASVAKVHFLWLPPLDSCPGNT